MSLRMPRPFQTVGNLNKPSIVFFFIFPACAFDTEKPLKHGSQMNMQVFCGLLSADNC